MSRSDGPGFAQYRSVMYVFEMRRICSDSLGNSFAARLEKSDGPSQDSRTAPEPAAFWQNRSYKAFTRSPPGRVRNNVHPAYAPSRRTMPMMMRPTSEPGAV